MPATRCVAAPPGAKRKRTEGGYEEVDEHKFAQATSSVGHDEDNEHKFAQMTASVVNIIRQLNQPTVGQAWRAETGPGYGQYVATPAQQAAVLRLRAELGAQTLFTAADVADLPLEELVRFEEPYLPTGDFPGVYRGPLLRLRVAVGRAKGGGAWGDRCDGRYLPAPHNGARVHLHSLGTSVLANVDAFLRLRDAVGGEEGKLWGDRGSPTSPYSLPAPRNDAGVDMGALGTSVLANVDAFLRLRDRSEEHTSELQSRR